MAKPESYFDMAPRNSTAGPNANIWPPSVSGAQIEFSPHAQAFLNHLRFISMRCRVKPQTDLFEACALLKVNRSETLDAHAEALVRCLGEAFGKPPRLYAPGTSEFTFDEQWLMRLGIACVRDDEASQQFLLGSRVAFENRRFVHFLIGRIAEHFALN